MFAKVKPNTRFIGQNIIYFKELASTNEFALELSKQNMAENGTVVIAEFQTLGRGQLGRSWFSEPYKNLMFSLVLRDVTNSTSDAFLLNKSIAVALQESIQKQVPKEKVSIKWPNDIYIGPRKVCGILVENSYNGSQISQSIVGIGINVNQAYEEIPTLNATSLIERKKSETDREKLLKDILENIESQVDRIITSANKISTAFDKHLYKSGEQSLFEVNGSIEVGIVRGCDASGRLLVELNNQQQAFVHGQIRQLSE